MKTTDFLNENFIADATEAHQDHEVQMARSDCYNAAKYAIELHKLLKHISEQQGLDGWVSEKITLANDYLRTVTEYLRYEQQSSSSGMPEFDVGSATQTLDAALGESQQPAAKTNKQKAVVKTNKPIGTRVADIGPGGKEYNVKTNKAWDDQHKKVDEERTETRDETGKIISWRDESDWRKVDKEKDGRGKVTNLSDKARKETEKLKKQQGVEEGKADPVGSWVVYDGGKVKRFKSRDGAKAYAEKNGGKVASSEFYADNIQKQGVAEGSTWYAGNGAIKEKIAKYEELALKANREGNDAKTKMYQQKIQTLKQKMSHMEESAGGMGAGSVATSMGGGNGFANGGPGTIARPKMKKKK